MLHCPVRVKKNKLFIDLFWLSLVMRSLVLCKVEHFATNDLQLSFFLEILVNFRIFAVFHILRHEKLSEFFSA